MDLKNIDLSKLKAAASIAQAAEPTPGIEPNVTSPAAQSPLVKDVVVPEVAKTPPAPIVPATKYQHYKSSRIAMRMITPTGGRITFTGYEYITCDENIIEFLDSEIKLGLSSITKGELLTKDEANPMEALRRKHFAEFEEQRLQSISDIAKGITRDMGNNEGGGTNKVNPQGSGQVAN